MIDDEQIALLVYNHAVQLTLIDYQPEEAFRLACVVAARAFDTDLARADMDAAREALAMAKAKKAGGRQCGSACARRDDEFAGK